MIAARTPFAEGVAHERERFLALRDSEAAHALRYLFFAERANPLAELTAAPATLTRVSVIGAGTMGSGIALAALRAGYRVDLIERDAQALAAGVERIEKAQQQLIERRGTTATPLSPSCCRVWPAALNWRASSRPIWSSRRSSRISRSSGRCSPSCRG